MVQDYDLTAQFKNLIIGNSTRSYWTSNSCQFSFVNITIDCAYGKGMTYTNCLFHIYQPYIYISHVLNMYFM